MQTQLNKARSNGKLKLSRRTWAAQETSDLIAKWKTVHPNPGDGAPIVEREHLSGEEWKRPTGTHIWVKDSGDYRLLLARRSGKEYDIDEEYEKTRTRSAVVTPHGLFWTLPANNLVAALRFMGQYGPLGSSGFLGIDVSDFFRKQIRFKLVTRLWFTLRDEYAHREAWRDLAANIVEINRADEFPVGGGLRNVSYPLEHEWTRDQQEFERWVEEASPLSLLSQAIVLVRMEVNKHLEGTPLIYDVVPGTPAKRYKLDNLSFELSLERKDLWSHLWYLFALDTSRKPRLRLCLEPSHGEKLFYAPREDRYFCTSEEQKRFSKQDWWDRNKEPELRKRKLERATARRH